MLTYSAGCHHGCNSILTGFSFSKNQTYNNLMGWDQDCRIVAHSAYRPWNRWTLNDCHYIVFTNGIGWNVVNPLCSGCHVPVHQPGKSCEGFLQVQPLWDLLWSPACTCCSFLSYPLFNTIHITVASSYTLRKHSQIHVSCTSAAAWNSIITHFNCMLISSFLESTVVLPYIERNSCDKLNMISNVQGLQLHSGYSSKSYFRRYNIVGITSWLLLG